MTGRSVAGVLWGRRGCSWGQLRGAAPPGRLAAPHMARRSGLSVLLACCATPQRPSASHTPAPPDPKALSLAPDGGLQVYFAELDADALGGTARAFLTADAPVTITSVGLGDGAAVAAHPTTAAQWLAPGFRDALLNTTLPPGVSWLRAFPNPVAGQQGQATEVAVRLCQGVDIPSSNCVNSTADGTAVMRVQSGGGGQVLRVRCAPHPGTIIESIAFEEGLSTAWLFIRCAGPSSCPTALDIDALPAPPSTYSIRTWNRTTGALAVLRWRPAQPLAHGRRLLFGVRTADGTVAAASSILAVPSPLPVGVSESSNVVSPQLRGRLTQTVAVHSGRR